MKSGIFVGLNSGFIVQKPKTNSRKAKPSYKKGKIGNTNGIMHLRKENQDDQGDCQRNRWLH